MVDILSSLTKLGLSQKEAAVYRTLLQLGPSPVRKIALAAKINRGTTYDILKALQEQGLVSYYHEKTHQYFVAEDPEKLRELIHGRRRALESVEGKLNTLIPELRSLFVHGGEKPVVRYYTGDAGIRTILLDVLETVSRSTEHRYVVYSSANIRDYLYRSFADFTKRRVAAEFHVRVLSLGEGGEDAPLSERKWMTKESGMPTYRIIYGEKTAFISLDSTGELHGVILEDRGIATTERLIFDTLWRKL